MIKFFLISTLLYFILNVLISTVINHMSNGCESPLCESFKEIFEITVFFIFIIVIPTIAMTAVSTLVYIRFFQ